VNNTMTLVSTGLTGGVGNGVCRGSMMTPDGRYVAFVSAATNLVADDTNRIPDVFVRDLQADLTTLVSAGAKSTNSSLFYGASESPDITPDGRYVAFFSTATNLVPGVTTPGEVYVRDLIAGTTTWVSSNARAQLGSAKAMSYNQAISADGQFVVYETSTNTGLSTVPSGRGVILRFNVSTGTTDLVSTNANLPTAAFEDIRSLEITPDGRFVVFVANTNNSSGTFLAACIYLWDAQSGATTLVSGDLSNSVTQGSSSLWPAIDPTGRFVAFSSNGPNLVTNSLVGDYHLYVRDLLLAVTTLVDADTNGVGCSVGPSTAPRLSADGRSVAFESFDANLVADDRNHAYDLFLRDMLIGTNELISVHHPTLPSGSPNGPSLVGPFSVSGSGRYIAFGSDGDNLVANDTNGFRDVFVRDLLLGTTTLVSANTNGVPADNLSSEPAISSDARYVAFTSSADDLVPGDTNKTQDVFIRDLQSGTTFLVSSNRNGTGPGNNTSYSPIVIAGGRFVLFRSKATDLTAGSFTGTENLFLRDLQLATNYALTTSGVLGAAVTPDGRLIAYGGSNAIVYLWDTLAAETIYTNALGPAFCLGISPDGNRLACLTTNTLFALDRAASTKWQIGPALAVPHSNLRFSADSRFLTYAGPVSGTNQVFLYDFQTGTNLLLSQAPGGLADGLSDSPDISADAHLVAYRSFATNLTPGDGNGVPDLFLYDVFTGSTSLLSATRFNGGAADNRSLSPLFSADGRVLVFQSAATDLVAQDFNYGSDILWLALLYASITPGTDAHGPTIAWPARPGETYQVQFKNALSDASWQTVTGSIIITANQAQLTDPSPSTAQRFYRITAF
jgi:Tol biopolymer transport system component